MIPRVERRTRKVASALELKSQFREIDRRAGFGNKLRSWETLPDLIQSGYDSWLTIRSHLPDSPFMVPCVHWDDLGRYGNGMPCVGGVLNRLLDRGAHLEDLYFQEI